PACPRLSPSFPAHPSCASPLLPVCVPSPSNPPYPACVAPGPLLSLTAIFPQTEIMRNEFERLAARQPLELLSMKRYELPAPSSGQKNDITAWQECVNNSMAQLEHQAVRIENLELMSQHGCNAWKVYNEHLVHMIEQAQKELQKLRKNIQDLNWQRKNMQLTAGAKLREMESTWVSLVSKNYEIERTIVQLENEISQIKQQHGEANKENIQQDFQ
ncbi:PREDICTED: pre-mRNA-splicing factor SPF27, partial [Ficedula albicollis]|uniref:pre-mRNA-splicing factor SPF27 n=1 Tax=Ficedula albicollis TaxID=59894 RepID=UPI000359F947